MEDVRPILDAATDLSGEALFAAAVDGALLYANRAFFGLYDYAPSDLALLNAASLWDDPRQFAELWQRLTENDAERWEGECLMKQSGGRLFMAFLKLGVAALGNGRSVMVGAAREEAADYRLEAALNNLSCLDPLTLLPDPVRFTDHLHQEWRRASRLRLPLSAARLNIDFFHAYNDRYGNRAGDNCLAVLARELKDAVRRPGDMAARTGGGEFSLLLPATASDKAVAFAEAVRSRVAALRLPHEGSPAGIVTVSIGAASVEPSRGGEPADLLKLADAALGEAKAGGRNRVASRR